MRAFLFALSISLIVHFLVFYEVKLEVPKPPLQNTDEKSVPKGSDVKFVKLQPKKIEQKPKKKVEEVQKKQKIVEPPKEFKKVKEVKPVQKKVKTKPKPIPDKKPIPYAKPEVKPFNLNDFLNAKDKKDDKEKEDEKIDEITKSYIKLYGEEFSKFSDETKKYLRESLSTIGQITQRYLEYPYLAAYGGQSGTNVIEFFLHPDGTISDVKMKTSSGYNILDWNTKDTIEKAYKDYPRPKEKTKIIIYVNYILK